jgi:hypothetical protein
MMPVVANCTNTEGFFALFRQGKMPTDRQKIKVTFEQGASVYAE